MITRTRSGVLLAAMLAAAVAASAHPELPPVEAEAAARLDTSPRHGEWVSFDGGQSGQVQAYIVYPERPDPAPVVLVVHEIFGLSDWVRAVADELAAEGFIAIAPDFLSGKAPNGSRGLTVDQARGLNSNLRMGEVVERLNAAARYGTSLPSAAKEYAVVGFCWGGGVSFAYATEQPALSAAVVYYGVSPATEALSKVQAPVLGLYGGDDARVGATVPPAQTEMRRLGKRYEVEMYAGAGHGFLRQQEARDGANMKAAEQAWSRTVEFLKEAFPPRASRLPVEPIPFVGANADSVTEEDDCCVLPAY